MKEYRKSEYFIEKQKSYEKRKKMREEKRKKKKMYFRRRLLITVSCTFLTLFSIFLISRGYKSIKKSINSINAEKQKENIEEKKHFSNELKEFLKAKKDFKIYSDIDLTNLVGEIKAGEYIESFGEEDGKIKIKKEDIFSYAKKDDLEKINNPNLFKVKKGILLVNKKYKLPSDYNPGEKKEATKALELMINAAKNESIVLKKSKSFISFNDLLKMDTARALKKKKKTILKAGEIEYQTGLAFEILGEDMDISTNEGFESTKESKWLKDNAHKYGFILRYPKDKEDFTDVNYSATQFRYIGVEVATILYEENICLEQYLEEYNKEINNKKEEINNI